MAARAIYIASGHGSDDPGAVANDLKERDANRAICGRLVTRLREHGLKVHTDLERGNLRASGEIADANRKGDVVIFLSAHHNAAVASARGLEVFGTGKTRSRRLATAMLDACLAELRRLDPTFKDRGVKEAKGTRAQGLVCNSPGASALIEFAFLTNLADAKVVKHKEYPVRMAEALCKALIAFLRREKIATVTYRPPAPKPAPAPAAKPKPKSPAKPKKPVVTWVVRGRDGKPLKTFAQKNLDDALALVKTQAMAKRFVALEKIVA